MNNDIISQVRFDQLPLECILTQKQMLYYKEYFREGKTLSEISIKYDVSISNICHVLKTARRRIIDYYEGGESGCCKKQAGLRHSCCPSTNANQN